MSVKQRDTNRIVVLDLAKTVLQGHLFGALFEGLGEGLVVLEELWGRLESLLHLHAS